MPKLLRLYILIVLISCVNSFPVFASEMGFGWPNICKLNENISEKSLGSILFNPYGRLYRNDGNIYMGESVGKFTASVIQKFTASVIQSNNIINTIKERGMFIKSENFSDMNSDEYYQHYGFTYDFLQASILLYLLDEPDNLKSVLDYLYEAKFTIGYVDQLDRKVTEILSNTNENSFAIGVVKNRLDEISKMAVLYYKHWELSTDTNSLNKSIEIYSKLRKIIAQNRDLLVFKYEWMLDGEKRAINKLLPSSDEYYTWQYTGYLEIALAQKALLEGNFTMLASAVDQHKKVTDIARKELQDAASFIRDGNANSIFPLGRKGEIIEHPEGNFLVSLLGDTQGSHSYLLFGKPQREILYQNALMGMLEAVQARNLEKLQNAAVEMNDNRDFMESYSLHSPCDEMFMARFFLLKGQLSEKFEQIAREKQGNGDLSKEEVNRLKSGVNYSVFNYSQALSYVKFEESPVLWIRAFEGKLRARKNNESNFIDPKILIFTKQKLHTKILEKLRKKINLQ